MDHLRHLPRGRFRFIGVDVETANRSNSSICQIGLAFVGHDGRVATYSALIDPETYFAPGNVRVHGLSERDCLGAPTFADVIEDLRPVMEAHPLVQHSRIDERAFNGACRLARVRSLDATWLDSVQIARKAWPDLRRRNGGTGHGLASLKRALGLRFHHHDAGEDARACAQVVLAAEDRIRLPKALHPQAVQLELPL